MIKDLKLSYFIGGATHTNPEGTMTLEEILTVMTDQSYGYSRVSKKSLPYFTITGQFSYRNNLSLIKDTYTWLCPFDIDYKENLEVNMDLVKNMICSDDSVIFCGKSPSGKGLKGIVRLKKDAYNIDDHYKVLKHIYRMFEKSLGCIFDDAQAKLSQPFYFTFDKDAYINYDAVELNVDYTVPKEDITLEGDISSLKKDYLIDRKCDEIKLLTSNKWVEIGKIGYTLGGWFKYGHFTLNEQEIKEKLKKAVDFNKNILNKQQKYTQIDVSFKNGYEKPIPIKEVKLIDVSEVSWEVEMDLVEDNFSVVEEEGGFNFKTATFDELKKYRNLLSKSPVRSVADLVVNRFVPGKVYEVKKYLLYPLLIETQLGILFGLTGEGKTIFAIEMANQIANGESIWEGFRCECEPQKVIYIDFELGSSSFAKRYNEGKFSENLIIENVDVYSYNMMIGFDSKQGDRIDRAIEFIENTSKRHNSKVLFIDNLSNIADQIEQAAEADRFISDLIGRMKALDLTIMFLGHTPKLVANTQLNINQLKGSSSLTKSFESVIGFKRSLVDKNISYIRQLKSRDADYIFDEEHVGKFEFDKNGNGGWSLNYLGTDEELNLLKDSKKGGRPQKYDDDLKVQMLYDAKTMTEDEVKDKYSIPRATYFRIKKELSESITLREKLYEYEKNMNEFSDFNSSQN